MRGLWLRRRDQLQMGTETCQPRVKCPADELCWRKNSIFQVVQEVKCIDTVNRPAEVVC
jgi:hypothetical protein